MQIPVRSSYLAAKPRPGGLRSRRRAAVAFWGDAQAVQFWSDLVGTDVAGLRRGLLG